MAEITYRLDTEKNIEYFTNKYQEETAWEKLQDKTQVFNERVNEKVTTRGSHSSNVGDIAASLAEELTDDSVKIAKSRLLGQLHDIGHIPFGHAGESVADSIIQKRYEQFTEEEKKAVSVIRESLFGKEYADKNKKPCFEHNENSVLQYYIISSKLGYEVDQEIVEGILAHSTSRYPELPKTLVQQTVRLADKVAYINYDVEDLRISFEGKEEWEALKKIYSRPILDADGKPIVVEYNGKKYSTVLEFLEDLSIGKRINIFIEEAVRIAKEDAIGKENTEYKDHETVLTGGNDLVVRLASLKKNPKYFDKATKKWTIEGEQEKKRLKQTLIDKSPILYLSYEMKERSDEFIRAGVGLSAETKQTRAQRAQSAVGNDDLKNQYIYNKLVTFIENRHKIDLDKLPESLKNIFVDLFQSYDEFKQVQEEIIRNLPGNEKNYQYPEIYTILNFIGSYSNTELMTLSNDLGLDNMFEQEVIPQLEAIINNEKYYDMEKHKFTDEGITERNKLVEKYGAYIKFRYGMDEYDFTPTTREEVIVEAMVNGYQEEQEQSEELERQKEVEDTKKQTETINGYQEEQEQSEELERQKEVEDAKKQTETKQEDLDAFHQADALFESSVITYSQERADTKTEGVLHGRK